MTSIAEQLFEDARALSDEDRIALAEKLICSISPDAGIFEAQLDEVENRAAALADGSAITIPGETALRIVREAGRNGRVA